MLPATDQLLVGGGDARLALDPATRLNKYGCRPYPDPDLAAFGSSTCSVISERGFAAAEALRQRLLRRAASNEPPPLTYRRETERLRRELLRLCDLSDLPGVEVVLAPSGTDLHRIAAALVAGETGARLRVIMTEAAETGSGVPAALVAGAPAAEVIEVAARGADGAPRPAGSVADAIATRAAEIVAEGGRVLLTVADVSKTGLVSPGLDFVLELRRRWGEAVEVLVDACQFRLSAASLRAYLQHGMMVAVTGSKFLTGPAFSGALLVPPSTARRLGWANWRRGLSEDANYGLLLRWEAALAELRAFRRLPEPAVVRFVGEFADAVQRRLADDPQFDPVAAPGPDRRPLTDASGWDHLPTIFPLLLRRGAGHLAPPATERVYRRLSAFRCQVGQPVSCGRRAGRPVSALRLCLSSRLIVDAIAGNRRAAVIDEAMAVLDKAVVIAHAARD